MKSTTDGAALYSAKHETDEKFRIKVTFFGREVRWISDVWAWFKVRFIRLKMNEDNLEKIVLDMSEFGARQPKEKMRFK